MKLPKLFRFKQTPFLQIEEFGELVRKAEFIDSLPKPSSGGLLG